MKNIHVLPTDKPSRLILQSNNKFRLSEIKFKGQIASGVTQHIYITSDEEIKVGDWVYCTERKLFGKVIEIQLAKFKSDTSMLYFEINNEEIWCKLFNCKKIILTTDQDLIKDGVQAIGDEFLEWFVKNPSCEEVTVRKKSVVKAIVKGIGIKSFNSGYKIIIPKSELASKLKQILDNMSQGEFDEEWKKITDLKLEGPSIIIPKEESKQSTKNRIFSETSKEIKQKARDYGNNLVNKEKQKQHLINMMKADEELGLYEEHKQTDEKGKPMTYWGGLEKPKQETTLEKDAEREASLFYEKGSLDWNKYRQVFIEGAKWQQEPEQFFNDDRVKTLERGIEYLLKKQEIMYSEEEVKYLLEVQRGNCYVALLSHTKNDDIASVVLRAPEPGGKNGTWVK